MLWDPLAAWPRGRPWLWAGLAILISVIQGPSLIRSLRPTPAQAVDYFQLWASARNLLHGRSVYEDLPTLVQRYLGYRPGEVQFRFDHNSQTPTAILLAVPLAGLSYPAATLAWNLLSLAAFVGSIWLVIRGLALPFSAWAVFPAVTVLLICYPFRQQVYQGQLTLLLLLLVTGAWYADRSEHPWLAGALVGAAAAIKVFPGFLVLYFLLQKRWQAVTAAAAVCGAFVLVTAAVMGLPAYQQHLSEGIPYLWQFRAKWDNVSLAGTWNRLFNPGSVFANQQTMPVWRSPLLARLGTVLSAAVVLLLWARLAWRARSAAARDTAFGLGCLAMLLISPIVWNHYLLLVLLPVMLCWQHLPAADWAKVLFMAALAGLWLDVVHLTDLWLPAAGETALRLATPLQTLTVLAWPCYSMLVLFALEAWRTRRLENEPQYTPPSSTRPQEVHARMV